MSEAQEIVEQEARSRSTEGMLRRQVRRHGFQQPHSGQDRNAEVGG